MILPPFVGALSMRHLFSQFGVFNMLLEKNLVRDRGWHEFSVYPLFSPQSLIAEGTANYGIDIAFLFFVLLHALTGAYMVITDVEKFGTFKRALAVIAVVIGLVAFAYGTMTVLAFQAPTRIVCVPAVSMVHWDSMKAPKV